MESPILSFPVPGDIEQGITSIPSTQSPEDVLARQDQSFDVINTSSRPSSYSKGETLDGVDKRASLSSRLRRAIQSRFSRSPNPLLSEFKATARNIEGCPAGYPYLAAFTDSSDDFMIYRRFGFLHARLLLAKQDEIVQLERMLDYIDMKDLKDDKLALQNRAYDESRQQVEWNRKKLLTQIEAALLSYDKILLNSQQLVGFNRPTKREHRSVIYFFGHKRPIAEGEQDYIKHKEDLITLRPGREMPWFDAFMLKVIPYLHRVTMKKIFHNEGTEDKTKDPIFFFPRNTRIRRVANAIVLSWVLVLFTVPIYTLFHVGAQYEESNAKRIKAVSMGILFVSTMMFALGLTFLTRAKRHETFAASAAYCALLVVFIANLGTNAGNKSAGGISGNITHS